MKDTKYIFTRWQNFAMSKFKAFAEYKINVTQNIKFACYRVENISGKGENAGNQLNF